ncbi:hypothetical protein ACFQU3_19690 [Terrabacter sp. GCM10028922]
MSSIDMGTLPDWDPSAADSRSNCPSLHETLTELASLVDARWKARVDNIYGGRTHQSSDLAFSQHGAQGGVVVVSSEMTMSLIAYANLWGRFLTLFDVSRDISREQWSNTETAMLEDFRALVNEFQAQGLAALLGKWPLTFKSREHGEAAAGLVQSAERWILAHELAHHILRHGTNRPDKQAKESIQGGMRDKMVSCELDGMSVAQLEEIEADLLAFELIAGEYAKDTNAVTVLQAYQGACLALVAVGHLTGDWTADPGDSHPGTLARVVVITKWALTRHSTSVEDVLTAMPGDRKFYRLAAASLAYAMWAAGAARDQVAPTWHPDDEMADEPDPIKNYVNLAVMFGAMEDFGEQPALVWKGTSTPG